MATFTVVTNSAYDQRIQNAFETKYNRQDGESANDFMQRIIITKFIRKIVDEVEYTAAKNAINIDTSGIES